MLKKVVAFCSAIALSFACVLPLACVGADQHEHGGHHGGGGKSRFVPYAPFNDILNNINQEYPLSDFWHGIQVLNSSATDTISDNTTEVLQTWDKFKSYLASHMYSNVAGQRVKDLVDYANQSTEGLTTGKGVYSFIAKRSFALTLDDLGKPDLVETDTMYYWRDKNHTIANDFTGVQIGNFYMMPNTIFVIREFSDGRDPIMFYADATQYDITSNSNLSEFDNNPYYFRLRNGHTFTCVDSDGTVESVTLPSGSYYNQIIEFYALNNESGSYTNSIYVGDFFAKQAEHYSRFSDYLEDGILPNIFVLCNTVQQPNGSNVLFPNSASGGLGAPTWYFSSGGFISSNERTTDSTFNTQTDTQIDPRKPPALVNPDLRLNTGVLLTQANVDNYADFGVTFNDVTGKFDLDLNALAAGLAANIVPQFQAVFDGTYSAQPDIDSNDWSVSNLTNNYIDDYSDLVVDISNEVQEVLDSRSPVWVPPRYPAVNTSAFIPAQYPTIPTQTFQSNYVKSVGDTLTLGWDIFDGLGLCAIIVPIVIMLLLWRLTGR